MIDEKEFMVAIKPYFSTCRAGDREHARRVVKWVKELGKDREDLNLLVIVGHVHDIGWSGIAPKGKINLEEMIKLESTVSENSPKIISKILKKMHFSDEETNKVVRLVAAADKHTSKEEDEAIIVDADNLSKLCLEHLQEKYRPESFSNLMKRWESELPKRIRTKRGKEIFPKLLGQLKNKLNKEYKKYL